MSNPNSLEGRWACSACRQVIATDDDTYPPGHPNGGPARNCAACGSVNDPEDWMRVES